MIRGAKHTLFYQTNALYWIFLAGKRIEAVVDKKLSMKPIKLMNPSLTSV